MNSIQHGPQTPPLFHLQLYQEHESINIIFGELDCWNNQKDRKQFQNKCHSTKSITQPTKHNWKKHKNFKNTAYHLHTGSTICKNNGSVQTEMNAIKHEEATTFTWHS